MVEDSELAGVGIFGIVLGGYGLNRDYYWGSEFWRSWPLPCFKRVSCSSRLLIVVWSLLLIVCVERLRTVRWQGWVLLVYF